MVRNEYLLDLKDGHGVYQPCEVFAVSSYPGHALTFNVMIDGKYLYHYLPVMALCSKTGPSLSFTDSTYFNCPSGELSVKTFDSLKEVECQVFNRDGTRRCGGTYRTTFDWFLDNELCHLIEQDDGNYSLVPSHKLIFSNDQKLKLPSFKKLHSEFILGK